MRVFGGLKLLQTGEIRQQFYDLQTVSFTILTPFLIK